MRETPPASEILWRKRLPVIGAIFASTALVFASLAPAALADDAPETAVEEAVATAQAEIDATDEATPSAADNAEQPDDDTESQQPEPAEADASADTEDSTDGPTVEIVEPEAAQTTPQPEVQSLATVEAADDDEEDINAQDINAYISPSDIDEARIARQGVTLYGDGFEADAPVTLKLGEQTLAEGTSSINGNVNIFFSAVVAPGDYALDLTVGSDTTQIDMTVTEGGYDLRLCVGTFTQCYFNEAIVISAWDMQRVGLEFEANGFNYESPVTVSLEDQVLQETTTDEAGYVEGRFTADLSPGEYALTVSGAEGTIERPFTVIADDAWDWKDHDPSIRASRTVVTEAELAADPVTYRVADFPYQSKLDVYLNGTFVETIDHDYSVVYTLTQDLEVGEYTIEFRHPTGTLQETLNVVADEQGEPTYPGQWAGEAIQTGAGSFVWADLDYEDVPENHIYPLSLQVDENGNLTAIDGEIWWVCIGVQTGYIGSGYHDIENVPATPLTVDQPFEIMWEDGSMDMTINGVFNADGTASGTLRGALGACGVSTMVWSTTLDGDVPVPTPEPTPEPTPTPDPTPEPTPTDEPTEEPTPAPTEDPTEGPTSDPTPTEEPTPDPTDEPTSEPTPDPTPTDEPTEEPTPAPTEDPTPDPTPTDDPTSSPDPTETPDPSPTDEPTSEPTPDPVPTDAPTSSPDPTPAPTEDPTPDPTPTDEPTSSPDPTDTPPVTIPVETPSVDDLVEDTPGKVTAPATAAAGSTITVKVEGVDPGSDVGVWLFSTPVSLGTQTVADGQVSVTLPADTAAGAHSIAVWNEDGLVGWDTVTVTTVDGASPSPSDTTPPATQGPSAEPSDAPGTSTGQDDAAAAGTADSGTTGKGGLARTGASITTAAVLATVMLGAGVFLVLRRRSTN